MNRQDKAEFVSSFHGVLKQAPLVVVVGFQGTPVNQSNQIRRALDQNGIAFRVVKNTLAKRALDGTGMESISAHLTGMTALVVSGDDAVATAKYLRTAFNGYPTIRFIAGFYQGEVFVGDAVKSIADLPTREDMLSTLLRTMQEPGSQLLSVLQAPARDIVNLLHNYENKLSEAAGE